MHFDREQVKQYLQALGRQPSEARLRAFFHSHNPRKLLDPATGKPDRGAKGPLSTDLIQKWQAEGRGVYIVVNPGGDRDVDITAGVALFLEWDHKPVEWQLQAAQELHLPPPSLLVPTGGKSVHNYWILKEPIEVKRWKELQSRLLDYADADRSLKNPSRVMRLPGCAYIDGEGKPTGLVQIASNTGARYTAEEIEALLPSPEQQQVITISRGIPLPDPRPMDGPAGDTLEEIQAALQCIPRRVPGSNTYGDYRNILWGLVRACEEAGHDRETAISLMEGHSPSLTCGWDVRQVAESGGEHIKAGTFWFHARQYGWEPPRRRPPIALGPDGEAIAPNAPAAPRRRVVTREECRHRLATALDHGLGPADLELLIGELADASDQHPAALRALVLAIRQEELLRLELEEAGEELEAEARQPDDELTLAELFPPLVAQAVGELTRLLPYNEQSVACAYLAGVAGLLKMPTSVMGHPSANFVVPVNVYMAVVGMSGQKKTPLERRMVADPAKPIMLDLARQHARAMAQWREDCRGCKPAERPPQPRSLRLQVSDFTGEALTAQLMEQEARGQSLLIRRDELAGLFGSLNQYRGGRGGDEQQLLELFEGDAHSSLRVSAGDREFQRCQVSIYGSIQPAVLLELMRGGDSAGKWARFMFTELPRRAVPLPPEPTQAEEAAAKDAAEMLEFIARTVYTLPPRQYRLSRPAIARFSEFEYGRQLMVGDQRKDAHGALFGKSAGKVLRIAGLLQIVWVAAGSLDPMAEIELPILELAITLVERLDAYAWNLHQLASGKRPDNHVGKLMRRIHAIAQANGAPVSWKEIRTALSSREKREMGVTAQLATEAMQTLASRGLGEIASTERGGLVYTATAELP
jgi:hypothetical protein